MKIKLLAFILSLITTVSFANEVHTFKTKEFIGGQEFNLAEHLGSKVIIMNFFASWCTACVEELPELHELKAKYPGKDYLFIGINAGERKKLVKKFLRKYKFNYLILEDSGKIIAKKYGVDSLPRSIVISKDKKIVFTGNRPPKNLIFKK